MASDALRHLAKRVESDETFLACRLAAYRAGRGWDDARLAEYLRVSPDTLVSLALCGVPRSPDDVRGIADHFGCDRERLAEILTAIG